MTTSAAPADAGVLWPAALQRALARAAHDVKDALNGVSVNLEVVRSRASRADAPASAVAPFAEAAAQQLERLAALLDAVLALGRSERGPADGARARAARAAARSRDIGDAPRRRGGAAGRVARPPDPRV